MEVIVKLFAHLRKYAPAGSDGRKIAVDVPHGTTVRALAASLNLPEHLLQILLVNGNNASLDQELYEGDELSIFPYMAGGSNHCVQ